MRRAPRMQITSRAIRLPAAPWRPDVGYADTGFAKDVEGIPQKGGYTTILQAASFTTGQGLRDKAGTATGSFCTGAYSTRRSNREIVVVAGTQKDLFRFNLDEEPIVISQTTNGYTSDDTGFWKFDRFGNYIIAVNGADTPQKIDISTASPTAANLGGSPPVAKYVKTLRDFVVMANTDNDIREVRWSQIGDSESWTKGTNQADSQIFPEDGFITGLAGQDVAYIFTDVAIYRMNYVGPPVLFEFDKISNERGCWAPKSIVEVGDEIYFYAHDGFFRLKNDQIEPIGLGKINKWFSENMDPLYRDLMYGAYDPERNVVIWAVKLSGEDFGVNSTGPTKFLFFSRDTGEWGKLNEGNISGMFTLMSEGYSSDELDTLSANLGGLPFTTDDPAYDWGKYKVYIFENEDIDFGTFRGSQPYSVFIETGEFSLQTGERMLVKRAYPLMDGGFPMDNNVAVTVYARDFPGYSTDQSLSTMEATGQTGGLNEQTGGGYSGHKKSGRYVRAKVSYSTPPSGDPVSLLWGVDLLISIQGRR